MKKNLFAVLSVAATCLSLASCGGNGTDTASIVAKASKMSLSQLEEAAKAEMEVAEDTFKIYGLTSVLSKVATTFEGKYPWIAGKYTVNSSFKDAALLEAISSAENSYVCDYALMQDCRSFSSYIEDGLTHNYVPSDWRALGLEKSDTLPLRGVYFNKVFWTNTNFEKVTGKKLYNIWQVAGSSADKDHLSKVSFQSPVTEKINMSFLVSCYASENQKAIKDAYEAYYGKKWAKSAEYASAGEQWVAEFVKNISIWHSSDGTAMKETQLKDHWEEGVVYYGAFAKMKDAVGKTYDVDLDGDGTIEDSINLSLSCGGKTYTYTSEKKVNAMTTVKFDWEIAGFNGFMYSMDSQIVNNAKYPYTACLFARILLDESSYTGAIYNANTPDANGDKANQYGYYYPGTASSAFKYAKGDWTKEQHCEKEIVEDYEFLSEVAPSTVTKIETMCA